MRRERGFVVVSNIGRVRMAFCRRCRAVVTPIEGETLDEAIDVHGEWHAVMEEAIADVREELREMGIEP